MNKVEFSYYVDLYTNNGNTTWIGYCSTFEKADNDYKLRLKHDTIDSQKIERIVVTKSCYIFDFWIRKTNIIYADLIIFWS